ncbi:phenylalanine--tRNA ligase subunit beta [Leptothoe spongobia]|uniref:Phenylalanine--tRNA ligase beta subunit n=1 Tax=Leptothoe spongobia TAU-MAC 1115 TaxID=1967444 RepID=A0A947GJK0_9CYAN|nr:phenylalanine--tRNA ligase subunit beta [Leptothoe spongobia]MBT9315732.1 phenylalanine--tRNA ligase subunit beta [Leptothoe spongobia TAU-MAC 1115]
MRISVNWLKEFVDPQLTPEAIGDALTMAGFEVEDIEERHSWADGVVVGKVIDRKPHPNADKLSVCTVDIGEAEPSTIVCGAANVKADIFVAVAQVNTYLPQVDLKIKPRKIRGVPSAGMICSLAELGLAKDADGIHIFEHRDLEVGQDVRPLLGLDDTILDLSSTANRADALSMVGIAREVAAITGAELTLPIQEMRVPTDHNQKVEVALSAPKACPIYIGTVLEDIKIGSSPAWLKQRLEASGTRSINSVVDITNYVLLEWGQPLHAFDLDRLSPETSTTVSVRFGKPNETLKTLDSQERQIKEQTLVITANDVPVALAGVMGGADSEVHDDTQNVFLEAAFFDAAVIRRSARSQGLRTEASARYERGVNPAELELAANRAIQLMVELADAKVTYQQDERTEVGKITPTRTISLRLARVQHILGNYITDDGTMTALSSADVEDTLTRLGCTLASESEGVWAVTVPAYRYRDLEREIDLIEEVARLFGYNRFANTLPQQTSRGQLSPEAALARQLRNALRGAGLTEVLHYSLTNPAPERVVLENPLFTEYSALRSDLLSGLIDGFQFNLEQGNGPLNAFEIGHVFANEDGQLNEYERIGGILGGNAAQGQWSGATTPMTWYEAKGILETVFCQVGLEVDYRPESEDERLHPGRTASLWVRGRTRLGTFGQLHPRLRQERDLPTEVYVFELNWDAIATCLVSNRFRAPKFKSYSTYPGSDRDIAFYAPVNIPVADLEKLISRTGGQLLEAVTLFDEYKGKGVPEGQRSLAFRMFYRANDRTLTDQDIDPLQNKIRAALEKKFKVSLRS